MPIKKQMTLLLGISVLGMIPAFADGPHGPPGSGNTGHQGNGGISIRLNGDELALPVDAINLNGHVMVPMRAIFENLNATVTWNDATQSIRAVSDQGTVIKLTINSRHASVDRNAVTLEQAAILANGSTMVPLRFVAEALGATVTWDESSQVVNIND